MKIYAYSEMDENFGQVLGLQNGEKHPKAGKAGAPLTGHLDGRSQNLPEIRREMQEY